MSAGSEETSRSFGEVISPRFLLSLADGLPVVAKQLAQLLFLLCWPFWAVAATVTLLVGKVIFGFFWVLLFPVRAYMKKKDPEGYAASQKK